MNNDTDSLKLFHPLFAKWFRERVGTPTDIQNLAWPEIAQGNHVLVTAPTGSGKTLTAFLWAINSFVDKRNAQPAGRVLYISPLKALNNDIRRNLEEPLAGLRSYFETAGEKFPDIRVAVRSGDTEYAERRRMSIHPPDIFITTPESLNILLSSKNYQNLLNGISTVILDEIHAVAPIKRGTYLMTAVERLVSVCGEFQRIALSATVKPLEIIADFVGGYGVRKSNNEYFYEKRNVKILQSSLKKRYSISVQYPDSSADPEREEEWWHAIAGSLRGVIAKNHSTLLFANSRRMVEKITRLINEEQEQNLIYAHHGSLSKEIRSVVEKRLKDGELPAIAATSSLELGIDIGAVDEIVLLQTPYSISSAIQRIGRSGHKVGETSRGSFYPLHAREFLEAAVLTPYIDSGEIETIKPLENSLDVLAQVVLSSVLNEPRNIDELYGELRASYPYHQLNRKEYDLVLEMLAGRYADSRIRELNPRVIIDRIDNTITARENMRTLLNLSGGVIPDRGYYTMRDIESKARIGELDEEFVWERSLGDSFPFGNQIWQIQRITHNDVEVKRVGKSNSLVPFWKAEDMNRSFHLSEKIGTFLEDAEGRLESDEFKNELVNHHHMSMTAADFLIRYLNMQKTATDVLPHRHNLLVEHFNDPTNVHDSKQTILHTLWGGSINRPLSFALAAAWEEKYHYALEVFTNNDCIMLNLPHEFEAQEILSLVSIENITRLLRAKLESTGYFGARFRDNAQRALLLPRKSFHERMPLWMNRLRSKKLLDATSRYTDFPVLLETWRTCLNYDFDLETLYKLLDEIQTGQIKITEAVTKSPSPFAEGIIWRQTNYYMYADDTPGSKLRTNLSDELIKEMLTSPHLRPRLSGALIRAFEEKVQRTAEGYAPETSEDLLEFVKERLYVPGEEWYELLKAIERDQQVDSEDIIQPVMNKLFFLERESETVAVIALENVPRIRQALGTALEIPESIGGKIVKRDTLNEAPEEPSLAAFLTEWLRFYGPVSHQFLMDKLGLDIQTLSSALQELLDEQIVIIDEFRSPEEMPSGAVVQEEICDSRNLEILLRMHRAAARPAFEPLEITSLPYFVAAHQGIAPPGEGLDDLEERIEQLFGYPARAGLWESDIFPARLNPYYTAWLDSAMRESELIWFGCDKEKISFCFEPDYELFSGVAEKNSRDNDTGKNELMTELEDVLSKTPGKIGLTGLSGFSTKPVHELSDALWKLAWEGRITNDDYASVRRGVMNRFRAERIRERSLRRRPLQFNRWKNSRSFEGSWFALKRNDSLESDALDRLEIEKDRIRQLFMRYGVLFRELLRNEMPLLQWQRIFRTLRLMEFSGEIFTGHFFKGIPGLQFCSHDALRILSNPLPKKSIYWMNAADPASLCGIGIKELNEVLPSRLPTTHIVFHNTDPVLVSRRNGKVLEFKVDPSNPYMNDYLGFFHVLLGRQFQPLKLIQIETINGEPALKSSYVGVLRDFGFSNNYRALALRRKY